MLQKIARTYNIALDALMFGEEPKMNSYFVTRAGKGVSIERTRLTNTSHWRRASWTAPPILSSSRSNRRETMSRSIITTTTDRNSTWWLKARMLINIEGKEIILNQGDSIYFNSKLPHGMKALDGKTVRFLAVNYVITLMVERFLAQTSLPHKRISSKKPEKLNW